MRYLQYDALLAFMVAGFVVQNFSQPRREILGRHPPDGRGRVRHLLRDRGGPSRYPALPRSVAGGGHARRIAGVHHVGDWPLASRFAGDVPAVKKWGCRGWYLKRAWRWG